LRWRILSSWEFWESWASLGERSARVNLVSIIKAHGRRHTHGILRRFWFLRLLGEGKTIGSQLGLPRRVLALLLDEDGSNFDGDGFWWRRSGSDLVGKRTRESCRIGLTSRTDEIDLAVVHGRSTGGGVRVVMTGDVLPVGADVTSDDIGSVVLESSSQCANDEDDDETHHVPPCLMAQLAVEIPRVLVHHLERQEE
jgi:hypothetical protein